MKAAEQPNFIYAAAIDSFSFKHEFKSKALPFSYIAMGSVLYSVCMSIATFWIETFNGYQYRIFRLDFCSYSFHIFRFSRSGKGEIDLYRFTTKYSSDYYTR